ncbi:MAG: thymidine kinase [Candidatus Komeilibacteria bacterium]|nr:thymidine kinase [Candidatus Komeilibacteria bacterium]
MPYLKIITGPMFSGKTEELIRLLHRSQISGKKILVIKPKIDTRTNSEIASRKRSEITKGDFKKFMDLPATPVEMAAELDQLIADDKPDILALDEAQFFGDWIVAYITKLMSNQSDMMILVAGLDMDAWGKPFGSMPQLLAMADNVQKETAVCFVCKAPATMTQKLSRSETTVEVGDSNIYEARCRFCYKQPSEL